MVLTGIERQLTSHLLGFFLDINKITRVFKVLLSPELPPTLSALSGVGGLGLKLLRLLILDLSQKETGRATWSTQEEFFSPCFFSLTSN